MQEINKAKLRELLEEEKKLDPLDDLGREKLVDKLLYYCGDDENDIVKFLSTVSTCSITLKSLKMPL